MSVIGLIKHKYVVRTFGAINRAPEDSLEDVAMADSTLCQPEKWGISVEVSFVERKKSDTTLASNIRS